MNVHDAIAWIKATDISKYSSNLLGIGWGPKVSKGVETGEYGLIFSVKEKKPLNELLENEIIPQNISINEENYITDVVQSVQHIAYYADCHTVSDTVPPVSDCRERHRPLIGGIESETRWGSYVATLGLLVRDKTDGQIVALSNNHVYGGAQVHAFYNANNNGGYKNISPLSCYQPTGYYSTSPANDFIGKSKRCVVIGDTNYVTDGFGYITGTSSDSAIASVNTSLLDTTISPRVTGFDVNPPFAFATEYEINSLVDPGSVNFGAPVFKCGRTTGPIGYPGNSYSCNLTAYQISTAIVGTYSGYVANFQDCIFIRGNVVPGRGGDSGSAFFALLSSNIPALSTWKCIGLLFAGPNVALPPYTIVSKMSNIVNKLDIAPWDCTMPTLTSKTDYQTTNTYPSVLDSYKITLSGRTYYQLGR